MQSKYQDLIKKVEKHFCSNRYKTEMQAFIRDVEYQIEDLKIRLKKLEPEPEDISTDKDGHPLRKGNLIEVEDWTEKPHRRFGIFVRAEGNPECLNRVKIWAKWQQTDCTFEKYEGWMLRSRVKFVTHLPQDY